MLCDFMGSWESAWRLARLFSSIPEAAHGCKNLSVHTSNVYLIYVGRRDHTVSDVHLKIFALHSAPQMLLRWMVRRPGASLHGLSGYGRQFGEKMTYSVPGQL